MTSSDNDQVREQVRTAYAKVARGASGCGVGCCGTEGNGSLAMGYTQEDIDVHIPITRGFARQRNQRRNVSGHGPHFRGRQH